MRSEKFVRKGFDVVLDMSEGNQQSWEKQNFRFVGDLKCYCDENFVFSFPVFLSVISYLDPKFHESAKFFTI